MLYLYKFDFSDFVNDAMQNSYIDKRQKDLKVLQKNLVKELNIPPATFTRIKRKGYTKTKKVYDLLANYFKIDPIDYNELHEIESIISKAYTYIYYKDINKINDYYNELYLMYQNRKNNVLEILLLSGLALCQTNNKDNILTNYENIILRFVPHLNNINKTYIYLSLYNYYKLNKLDIDKYSIKLELYLKELPCNLTLVIRPITINYYIKKKDYIAAISIAKDILSKAISYCAYKIKNDITYTLIKLYFTLKDFTNVISLGENEIYYLQLINEYQLNYLNIILMLIPSYFILGKYDRALILIDVVNNYDDITNIDVYKSIVNLYLLLICYKMKDKSFNDYYLSLSANIDKFVSSYANVIYCLNKGNITSLNKAYRLLDKLSKANSTYYLPLNYLLREELTLKGYFINK